MRFVCRVLGEEKVEEAEEEGKERATFRSDCGTRWHVQSLFVKHEWRRRGIRVVLMGEVMVRAAGQSVAVMLGANTQRVENLYAKMGFKVELRGDGEEDDGPCKFMR